MGSSLGLRQRKKIATRRRLLAAAETLFAERQFDDVTVDQIAEIADVSQKTFFNYFPSKSQILKEVLLDWLEETQVWTEDVEENLTIRSAITPGNIAEILEWIAMHRRIMKMALRHTDFFDFIYFIDRQDVRDEHHLFSKIRVPRRKRVERAQQLKLIRGDIPARNICNIYDSLRIEVVRRWLHLPDEEATAENLQKMYFRAVEILLAGIAYTAGLQGVQAKRSHIR